MSLNWFIFSGCCSGTTFQIEAPTPPYSFSTGNTYYLITDQYTGCSQYLSSGYASGTTVYNLESGSTLSFTSCTQCITTYPCVPGPTPTPTSTPAPSATPTKTPTNTPTKTVTPSITPTKTPTQTPTKTPTNTPTPSITPTHTPTSSITPTQTPTQTKTPTNTPTPSITPTHTPTRTVTPTPSITPSITPTRTVTPTVTPTPSITPTITPTPTITKTPLPTFPVTPTTTPSVSVTQTPTPSTSSPYQCNQSSFCVSISLSSYTNYNGVYYNYGYFNSYPIFYAPDTLTPSYIYYNIPETRWCLSQTSGGTCILFGPTGSSSLCPDLDETLFFTNCPTPTPTNTDPCNTFDFTAVFDCNITSGSTPTPTPTITPTLTPTPTPTSTPLCNGKSVIFSGVSYVLPGPSPTPSLTPTNAVKGVAVTGVSEFLTFSNKFSSPYSKYLLDCDGYNKYLVSEEIPFNTGSTFSVIINGKSVCVTYNSDVLNAPTHTLESIESGNLFDCKFCISVPTATPTPTPTVTPTTTQTCPNVISTITTGTGSVAIDSVYNPTNNSTYIVDFVTSNIDIIDNSNNTLTTSINIGINPGLSSAVLDTLNNRLYVSCQLSGTVIYIDCVTNIVSSPIIVGTAPSWLSFDSINNRVYSINQTSNNVSVINTSTNTVISTINIGALTTPSYSDFDSITGRLFVTNTNSNTVSVIDCFSLTVINTITPPSGGIGPCIVNNYNNTLYLSNAALGEIYTYNTISLSSGTTITVDNDYPYGFAFDSNSIYLSYLFNSKLTTINSSTNTVISTKTTPQSFYSIVIDTTSNSLYATAVNTVYQLCI